jgi:glycosyltransferase involved in cell wall biosynthesis
MKLLIITQKVDINDDILGFFHHWLEKFSQKFEKITVICLQKEKYQLPSNVKILSLGKETGRFRLKYIWRFYKYIFGHWDEYEKVFIHMNPIYIVLGGLFWRLGRKKIVLWYNHPRGNLVTKIGYYLANNICYTSSLSFFSKYSKAQIMPAGIDTAVFRKLSEIKKTPNSILYLGRISPVKNVDILIDATKILSKKNVDFKLNIVGGFIKGLEKYEKIKFHPPVPNYLTPEIYNQNEIFVNLTNTGSFDKTILEAMACENIVLISNLSFKDIIPPELFFEEKNAEDLAERLIFALKISGEEKQKYGKFLRQKVVENHNLDKLIKDIKDIVKND